jgi:1,4-dihydroxy-2-naphthoate octaprenyltransferase
MNTPKLPDIISILRLPFLLAGIICYILGAGIAHYLGSFVNWQVFWLGQACVTLLQLMMIFMKEYFDVISAVPRGSNDSLDDPDTRGHLNKQQSLLVLSVTLTAGAAITGLLLFHHLLSTNAFVILAVSFGFAYFYASPPIKWGNSGYGELVTAVLLVNCFPALAFLLQTGELHRLLALTTFPLTPLYIAMALTRTLPTYARDMKRGYRTLLLRVGWKQGMGMHNFFVFASFLLLTIAIILGLPWPIAWPALLVLPIGFYQIWQMYRILDGKKPHWRVLSITASSTFGLMTYLLAFGFWLN